MKENNLKLAQQDIEEALLAVQTLEDTLESQDLSKDALKEKFIFLSQKVQELELILKEEGLLD